MKLAIRDQILWPLIGVLLIAVVANAAFSAWWMSTRQLKSLEARQQQIIAVLEESSFPLASNVMEKLRGLTGDELIVWDSAEQRVIVGTLPNDVTFNHQVDWNARSAPDTEPERRKIGDTTYLIRAGRIRGAPLQTLFLLTSDATLRKVQREAMWPPIAIGCATIVLLIPFTLLLASNWARRIRSLEGHVGMIAHGEFGLELPPGSINDELARLVESINSMSRQLRSMREQLVQGERTRLVAQLTAGFGHQLRNGLTGARLAIQLHESRCSSTSETSLSVARNQLALIEEEIQGLLSLGKDEQRSRSPVDLVEILQTVKGLVILTCEHQGVELIVSTDAPSLRVMGFAHGLRAAVLNLTLNAIEATGAGGHVSLTLKGGKTPKLTVEDDGPGPPPDLSESLFESFVTSKPEGVGLGLTVAMTVAQVHHGSLNWSRSNGRTQFEMILPDQCIE